MVAGNKLFFDPTRAWLEETGVRRSYGQSTETEVERSIHRVEATVLRNRLLIRQGNTTKFISLFDGVASSPPESGTSVNICAVVISFRYLHRATYERRILQTKIKERVPPSPAYSTRALERQSRQDARYWNRYL